MSIESDWKTIADIPPAYARAQPDAVAFSFETSVPRGTNIAG